MKILATFIVIVSIAAGIFYVKDSRASIDIFTFTPTSAGTDDVAGTVDANYDIAYTATDNSIITEVTLKLPSMYDIETGLNDDLATIIKSGNGTPTNISISGLDVPVSNVVFGSDTITITLTDPYDASAVGVTNDIEFTIMQGITNPTTAGTISPSGFTPYGGVVTTLWTGINTLSIDDDFSDSSETTIGNTFDIIAGPADHLVFTQEPSGPASFGQGTTSGTVFEAQPILEARDQYDNLATSYSGNVQIAVGGTGGGSVGSSDSSIGFCVAASGAINMQAVNGVADFSSKPIYYRALEDHEAFTLMASGICGDDLPEVEMGRSLTSDIIADALVWTADPSGCVSGAACTTQGTVEARGRKSGSGIGGIPRTIDLDYTGDITLATTGAGTIVGTSPQSMSAGLLAVAGLGYNSVDPTIDDSVSFTADSGSLSQGISGDVSITAAPPTPVPAAAPVPSAGGGYTPRPEEIPGYTPPTVITPVVTPALPAGCAPYLTAYLKFGNLGEEVIKLQRFLLAEGSYKLGLVTGFFGPLTEQAVNLFQTKYASDILTPQDLSGPTGYAKDYTQRKVNELVCKELVAV